jgi:hypothetical protein
MIDQGKRDRPYRFIMEAISLVKNNGGYRVLEIGSARQPLSHGIDDQSHLCCNDGHSTALFAASGLELDTVDINPNVNRISQDIINRYSISSCTATCCDGIDFIKKYDKRVDLLYLDAWDVDMPDSPEKHLEAYEYSKRILKDNCLILIDDTDIDLINGELFPAISMPGGKGRQITKKAVEEGFKIIFTGRQTLLQRIVI